MLNVIMLNVIMLNVIMLNVVMLNAVRRTSKLFFNRYLILHLKKALKKYDYFFVKNQNSVLCNDETNKINDFFAAYITNISKNHSKVNSLVKLDVYVYNSSQCY